MMDLTQTRPEIIATIREALAEHFGDLDDFGIFEAETDVHTVEHASRDGFIPFTNGGADCRVLRCLDNHGEALAREAQIIAPYVDNAERDAAEAFIANEEDLAEAFEARKDQTQSAIDWLHSHFSDAEAEYETRKRMQPRLPGMPEAPKFWETSAGQKREAFCDYKRIWLTEGGEYWLQGRAFYFASDNPRDVTGADEVYFHAGVNTDFTYGRDKGLELTFERTYKLARLTPGRVRIIVKAMARSYAT